MSYGDVLRGRVDRFDPLRPAEVMVLLDIDEDPEGVGLAVVLGGPMAGTGVPLSPMRQGDTEWEVVTGYTGSVNGCRTHCFPNDSIVIHRE